VVPPRIHREHHGSSVVEAATTREHGTIIGDMPTTEGAPCQTSMRDAEVWLSSPTSRDGACIAIRGAHAATSWMEDATTRATYPTPHCVCFGGACRHRISALLAVVNPTQGTAGVDRDVFGSNARHNTVLTDRRGTLYSERHRVALIG
jgi:hypothetical protein